MKNWKIKLAQAIEAVIFIVSVIVLGVMVVNNLHWYGTLLLVLAVLAGVAFYVTKNIEVGRTAFLGKEKDEKPVEKK